MTNKIMFGATVDEELVNKAKAKMRERMPIPVSNAAMLRILLGLMGDGKVDVIVDDLATYSMASFNKGGFAKGKDE